ncbi:hypothetical protein LY28_00392 [Ruminiclostridium sufflavum DSM 19573]|uniref:Uncharacterized protein n=1 Tax=Ruminiclostridium sufflavum DSM 19573 TaxID=1121337 RepID=A0A318XQW0_9FIRM|nr:hypothetical protein [Ruminiclostridium sufflavum]PYG89796.1 hypothetical protein LY28_00392 [Ruminiclostridium sufflavum DSM 19573]
MSSVLFERDLLYPTDNVIEPGIIHVKILNPDNLKMPVVVETKSNHSAVENVNAVLDVLQKDIFDRINIKIYDNTSVYILLNALDKAKYGDVKYIKVVFNGVQDFSLEPFDEGL